MTRPGYTHIIVSKKLHSLLKEGAKGGGISISKFIELSINTNNEKFNSNKPWAGFGPALSTLPRWRITTMLPRPMFS